MIEMFAINATDVRREWSTIMDDVVRNKPRFIKRTRDYMMLADIRLLKDILSAYHFTADKFMEDDGSITLSLNEIDLIENGKTEKEAKSLLAQSIYDYAENFYSEYDLYSSAPNRKAHIPYVLKALIADNINEIGDSIQCRHGKN